MKKNSTPLHTAPMQSAVFFPIRICSAPHATDARKTSIESATINKTVCTFFLETAFSFYLIQIRGCCHFVFRITVPRRLPLCIPDHPFTAPAAMPFTMSLTRKK